MRFLWWWTPKASRCWLVLVLWSLTSISCSADRQINSFDESLLSYVEYPQDNVSQALLDTETHGFKVALGLFSTADVYVHPLFNLIKGIVRRLDRAMLHFEPNYYIADGRSLGCRITGSLSDEEMENRSCRKNCTNFGRYCAASAPKDPSLAAKITGVSIIEETLRRRCG
jgi:hypothetical protein